MTTTDYVDAVAARFVDAITDDPERFRTSVQRLALDQRERAALQQRLRGLADWLEG